MDILAENFNMIKMFQKELMVSSLKYPDIDFMSFFENTTKMMDRREELLRKNKKSKSKSPNKMEEKANAKK